MSAPCCRRLSSKKKLEPLAPRDMDVRQNYQHLVAYVSATCHSFCLLLLLPFEAKERKDNSQFPTFSDSMHCVFVSPQAHRLDQTQKVFITKSRGNSIFPDNRLFVILLKRLLQMYINSPSHFSSLSILNANHHLFHHPLNICIIFFPNLYLNVPPFFSSPS